MAKNSLFIYFVSLMSVLLLSSSAFSGATRHLKITKEIEWKPSAKYPVLPFFGNGFFKESNGLPIVLLSIHLPDDFSDKDYSVSIDPMTWDTYEGTLADITKEDVSSGPVYRIVHIRKEPYLEIELIPFRASAEENTKWEKLVSFSLNISYEARSASHRLKSNALKYATASKLADGKWVKVGTSKRGMHKIPYSTLSDWGFSEPSKVQVYGNPGAMLPMANNAPRPDDLPAIGCLHKNNALFFFSPATWQWKWDENHELFKHQKHLYSPIAFFFLSQVSSSVKSPGTKDIIEAPETHTTETYDDLYFHEQDTENVLKSGNQWFGEKFNRTLTLEKSFTAAMPNILPGREAVFYTQVLGRANSAHGFEIDIDNTNTNIGIGTISLDNYEGYYGRISTKKELFNPGSTFIDVNYRYTNSATKSIGWIDYFIINATGKLSLTNESLVFRNKATTGTDNITSYHISGSTQNPHVWEITNPLEPVAIKTKILNNKLVFKDTSSSLKEYVAFDTNMSLPVPKFIENTPNQNLHGSQLSEMVIVAPPEFIDQANRLASLHMEHSGLSVLVANRDQIYNEFSWGHPDPGAIRSFVKMLYDRAGDQTDKAPQLLLLFGDGTFDNRHIDNTPEAPLPTYQSDNSIIQTKTFVTDDFFGFLDDEEGDRLESDRLDIGIGRFPVNNEKQAINAVNKSEIYLTGQERGKWKSNLTFIGDDGNFNLHMRDADRLARKVENNQPLFDINKIYFDAYEVVSGAGGKEFPGAKEAVQRAVTDGTLIFNYTGHGSENNLAHERIVTITDINNWNNKNKLPLFVTATCEFSRFDNHNFTSAGEEVFLNSNGGGIALLSTTRIVYSNQNFTLNNAFYNHAFEKDKNGLPLRLGEIMRQTKIESGSSTNKLNFTLLGDPALRLAYPQNDVRTVSLNNKIATNNPDTIRALSKNTIQAEIIDHAGKKMDDFNGTVFVTIFDKPVQAETLGNGNNETFEYSEYSNTLFKGYATVTNGEFNIGFVVPKDIRYNYDYARISYYAISDNQQEAAGAFKNFVVGGISNNPLNDNNGPEIDMYMNHERFKPGSKTGSRPMLYANISDESGINTSGIGIGHYITLIIDNDKSNPITINHAYTADLDNYKKGTIIYQLPALEAGTHEITLKVWDNYNNSSTASLQFKVESDYGINVNDFKAYPNPVKPGEDVYVTMHTDSPNSIINTTIEFIDISGNITGIIKDELISSGNTIGPYRLPMEQSGWNYSGICFVRLIFKTQKGHETFVVTKLVPRL